jgi:hypothetical protein
MEKIIIEEIDVIEEVIPDEAMYDNDSWMWDFIGTDLDPLNMFIE